MPAKSGWVEVIDDTWATIFSCEFVLDDELPSIAELEPGHGEYATVLRKAINTLKAVRDAEGVPGIGGLVADSSELTG